MDTIWTPRKGVSKHLRGGGGSVPKGISNIEGWVGNLESSQGTATRFCENIKSDKRHALLEELEASGHVKASDLLLIDQAMFKLFYMRLIDDWCMDNGPLMTDDGRLRLQPALGSNYLAFSNSMRLDLQAVREGKDREIKWDFVKAIREVTDDDNP